MPAIRPCTDSIGITWVCRTFCDDDPTAEDDGIDTTSVECIAGTGDGEWVCFVYAPPDWPTALSDDDLRARIEESARDIIESLGQLSPPGE